MCAVNTTNIPEPRVIQVTLDAGSDRPTVYEVDITEIGAREARMVRQATRIPWSQWLQTFDNPNEFDVDSVAVLVWVARMRAGDQVALETVEKDLDYRSDVKLALLDPDADPDIESDTDGVEVPDSGEVPAGI